MKALKYRRARKSSHTVTQDALEARKSLHLFIPTHDFAD
jgi:hypothetical protein